MIKELQNKKICILGLGIENHALVCFLIKHKISCEITICDARSRKAFGERYKKLVVEGDQTFVRLQGYEIKWRFGKSYDKNLSDFDIIIRSPGYPLFNKNLIKAKKNKVEITSAIKLFFKICPSKNIIGVTGTKGKGTTASLISEIIKKSGKRVWLGGNIGTAPFEFIDKIKKNDWVVLELSSFQLEDMDISPKIAVLTNFYKEHLAPADPNNPNYHRSAGDYKRAKLNIIKFQNKKDFAAVNKSLVAGRWSLGHGRKVYFGKSELDSKLIGEHNKENIAAAIEVAKIVGVKQKDLENAIAKFKGLEYRIEFVRNLGGVKYYNDSFSTTPESTIIALRSFDAPIILLAGGADKGADFKQMAREIKKRCKVVILLKGKGTRTLENQLSITCLANESRRVNYQLLVKFSDLNQAIKKARSIAKKGDIILLSPACASFGMFKNYKQRGKLFKQAVKNLK